jgi:intracellular multiplication protein IcmO
MAVTNAIDFKLERDKSELHYDTRGVRAKIRDLLADDAPPVVIMAMFGAVLFLFPSFAEVVALLGIAFFFYARSIQKSAGLALRMPKSSGEIDPKQLSLGAKPRPQPAEGIVYMGNDMDNGEEVWLTDVQARTHMLFMGTTGSGKTEYLISLVYNSLIHGSGLIYVDGKADSSLYGKLYSMARAMGREDDVLVINFQTGGKDIYGAMPSKLSNTLNPFANGSSGMLSELVKGLMATGEKSTWTQQAESFVEALMKPLVYLRDNHGLNLDVNVIRTYFELNQLEDLAWRDGDKYPGLVESGVLDGLHNYLLTKPAYKKEKYHDQSETTNEQHGYITMQLIRTFNSLSDTYGYIMKTPLAEIDFVDVFLNRRILVVLLPALEKSPSELTNLGRIVVASIKATMAKGLGSTLEGSWKKVIASKPTTAPSPFMCVLDEYGYYAVEGFAVVPAQARSLGFSAIFAGQDLPAFEKASKEEAASTLANTNTRLCGKLECTKTYAFFKEVAGTGTFTQVQRYERQPDALEPAAFKAEDGISIDRVDRVSFEALRGQDSGQWHLFFANTILRVRSFFSNPKPVKNLRVNHFIKVGRPDSEEIAAFRKTYDLFTRAVSADGGLMSFMDRVSPPQDMEDISDAFKMFKDDGALLRAGKVLAYCAQAEGIRARAFSQINAAAFDVGIQELDDAQELDFTRQMAGAGVEPEEGAGMFIDSAPAASGEQGAQTNERRGLFPEDPYLERPADAGGFGSAGDDAGHLEDIDDHLYGGIPGDVANIGSGEPEWQSDGGLVPDFIDDASAATRGPLVPAKAADSAQFFDQTSVFGADNYEVPGAVLDADNDAETDALDRPSDVAHAGDGDGDLVDIDMAEFAAPMADEGLLSREATISGLAAIERAVGAPETESLMTASAVAESIGDATKYPMTPPSTKPDLTRFEAVARRLSHVLSVAADSDE